VCVCVCLCVCVCRRYPLGAARRRLTELTGWRREVGARLEPLGPRIGMTVTMNIRKHPRAALTEEEERKRAREHCQSLETRDGKYLHLHKCAVG
jgi:hypothetical protein